MRRSEILAYASEILVKISSLLSVSEVDESRFLKYSAIVQAILSFAFLTHSSIYARLKHSFRLKILVIRF